MKQLMMALMMTKLRKKLPQPPLQPLSASYSTQISMGKKEEGKPVFKLKSTSRDTPGILIAVPINT
jgi:hypothetical protein